MPGIKSSIPSDKQRSSSPRQTVPLNPVQPLPPQPVKKVKQLVSSSPRPASLSLLRPQSNLLPLSQAQKPRKRSGISCTVMGPAKATGRDKMRPSLVSAFGGETMTRGETSCPFCLPAKLTLAYRNIAERCPGDQTNNRAELIVRAPAELMRTFHSKCLFVQAIVRILEELPASTTKLIIKTDSKYSISCPHLPIRVTPKHSRSHVPY